MPFDVSKILRHYDRCLKDAIKAHASNTKMPLTWGILYFEVIFWPGAGVSAYLNVLCNDLSALISGVEDSGGQQPGGLGAIITWIRTINSHTNLLSS